MAGVFYIHLSPDILVCLAALGIALIYAELCAPGRVLPGVAGGVLFLASAWTLGHWRPAPLGMALLAGSAALFIVDAWVARSVFPAIAATALLAAGFMCLFGGPERIHWWAAISSALPIGFLTCYLSRAAAKARRNKRLPSVVRRRLRPR